MRFDWNCYAMAIGSIGPNEIYLICEIEHQSIDLTGWLNSLYHAIMEVIIAI